MCEYDANGNITKDLNRNILSIQYNSLNLPTVIEFTGGKTIKYTYSADGHKLRAVYTTTTPATSKTVDYCGNLIFENGQLKQMLVDGGYIPMDDWSGSYCFYVKDHLGNNRMVVHQSGSVDQVNNYYPYGGLMANSTGWNAQRYKYNGKEFDRMHGLDWYDYGARWMDASIGRWHSVDPLAEKYYNVSPYVYCENNPVKLIDPDGKDPTLPERILIGGGVGFIIGGGIAIFQGKSGRDILGSAVEGAVIGGTIGATWNIELGRKYGATTKILYDGAVGILSGSVSSAAGNAASQYISSESINLNEVENAAASGAVLGGVTGVSSGAIREVGSVMKTEVQTSAKATKDGIRINVTSQSKSSGSAGGHSSRTQTNTTVAKLQRSVDKAVATQLKQIETAKTAANISQQGFANTWGSSKYEFPIKIGGN